MNGALNLAETRKAIRASIRARLPLMMAGDPGIGKTHTAWAIAKELNLPLWVIYGAQCDPSDIGGIPIRDAVSGCILRLPIGPIREASLGPGVLLIDEYDKAPLSVRGAIMSVTGERRAGDVTLHEGVSIILGANDVDVGDGSSEIGAASRNRISTIRVCPSHDEVSVFLSNLGTEGSNLHTLGVDFAACVNVRPDLLQTSMPKNATVWASPRAIVRGLTLLSELEAEDLDGVVGRALFAGIVGEPVSDAWFAIRKVRHMLPSVSEILSDPLKARTPNTLEQAIASVGLLAVVARSDVASAWSYAGRISDRESVAACASALRRIPGTMKGAHKATGERARVTILGSIGADLSTLGA